MLRQARACTRRAVPKERMSPKTCPYLTLTTIVATGHYNTKFSMFWRSSLPVRGISSCGIEALSNLVPHLEQLHMLAFWGRLWSRLGFRFWNGFRLPIPQDETVINNMFGEVKLALRDMAKAPNPTARLAHTICISSSSHHFPIVVNVVRDATIRGTRSGNISHD